MPGLLSIASLLLASALPAALATGYTPDYCDDFSYEIYRHDLGKRSDFHAEAVADAFGPNAQTYTDQYLISSPYGNFYDALLTSHTDDGYVVVFAVGSGKALDCDKIKELKFIEVDGYDCVYRIDVETRKVCDKALARWDGFAYAGGEASVVLTVENIEVVGYSATTQTLDVVTSDGTYGGLHQSNQVHNQDGTGSSASANTNFDVAGNAQVHASQSTTATSTSASSSSSISSSSSSGKKGGKKGRRGRMMLEE